MKGKIVVITGANRGLGYAMSEKIASMGATVIMGCRDFKKGEEAARKLLAKGLTVKAMIVDVGNTESIDAFSKTLASQYNTIDVLINNAAISNEPGGTVIETIDLTYYRQIMDTNVLGTLWMCRNLLALLKKSADGRIINFSSGLGQLTVPRMGPCPTYSISKTAVNAITKILADEVKETNITVFSVDPGWIKTDLGGPNAMLEIPEGIDTSVWLASTEKKNLVTGEFYKERTILGW
jgi:NAD(P)-dependent dehydrogenase (short-subunit alcohol dehydrogenase family)